MATERQLPPVGEEIHLPGPSAQPLLVAVFTTIALIGVTQPAPYVFIIGMVGLLITLYAWIRDAIAEFKALPDHHDHGHDDHGHDEPASHEEAVPAKATDH
jgi:xanthosine utilization system XapX-like protein